MDPLVLSKQITIEIEKLNEIQAKLARARLGYGCRISDVPLEDQMIPCPVCGADIHPAGSLICPECGTVYGKEER